MAHEKESYRLTKQFSMISFLAITLSAFLIFMLFRYETTETIEQISREANYALTKAIEDSLNDHFVMFLNTLEVKKSRDINALPMGPTLERSLTALMSDTNVVRMKIYDQHGTVVYSTKASQIGDGQEENPGYMNAMNGKPSTVLIYRDSFNFFDKETEDDNLIQTYVPIIPINQTKPVGVFEVYSDINELVAEADKKIYVVLLITLFVMLILYAFLVMAIKRSENIIEKQNRETREGKKMLEFLTAKMINAQEDEKKRIAFELHEDVVQTISAVKMQLERYINSVEKISAEGEVRKLTIDILPVLQETVRRIRAVAVDLRPPSLDDFGLRAAIGSLITDCHALSHAFEVKTELDIDESKLTSELKSILFRMIKDTIHTSCFQENIQGSLRITLRQMDGDIVLKAAVFDTRGNEGKKDLSVCFSSIQERTILSGGAYDIEVNEPGKASARSSWHV